MAAPANAAVRENRRRSTPLDLERVNVMKALTAAEYSRRQFILNFAASRDTQLLVPGQKSDAVKSAEEWVVAWLAKHGHRAVKTDFFKYTVDARLWAAHGRFCRPILLRPLTILVGDDVEFPFAFMRTRFSASPSEISSLEADKIRPRSEAFVSSHDIDLRYGETIPVGTSATSPRKQQASSTQTRHRAAKHPESDKKRSLSLNSLDDLKAPNVDEKIPFLARLSRSWSRRLSAAL